MAEIIARYADGRLLVQEDRLMENQYISGGVPVRIGLVKTVEKVLSIDTKLSGYPGQNVAAPLNEVLVSGDTIIPILRRHDVFGLVSGPTGNLQSGYASIDGLSGVVLSGTAFGAQLTSGSATSGR
ncbi:unnamed protein product, partial [marine sediment metagenome]